MKNRHGDNNKIMPVGFIGENGMILDLPAPDKLDIFAFNDMIEKKMSLLIAGLLFAFPSFAQEET